ncbi:hypothetical protein GPAL_2494 [Glaciecola pallidula DSM 14239 = ACAM 615]|uniref:Arsenate reductase n=1 Tax=Brumicola pallidula DSM 14239 = ACAM 615 TaxID=1121922 RepID=K6YZJ7_9ALTE|nr:hypothetical protein GPAL_2494 [Glaciecola pallidula DSM 14239 = ACAM 615]
MAFLTENNIQIDIKEYLSVPFETNEISNLLQALGFLSALDMVRTKGSEFAGSGLTLTSSNSDIIEAIMLFPKLLERPILTNGKHAAIGRPLENIKELVGLQLKG